MTVYLDNGNTASTLQQAEVDVISNTDCKAVWGNKIDDEDICTQDLTSGTVGPCDVSNHYNFINYN